MNAEIMLNENSKLKLGEFRINENKILIGANEETEYTFHIDVGTVNIYDILYNVRIESTNISIENIVHNMAYYFNGYLFEISNNLVRFRGEIIHIDKFILNVSVGRIWIQNNYHSFGIINNELQIGPIINNYNNIDLYQLPNNENPRINQELKILKTLQQPELKNLAKDRQNVHDSYVLNKFKEIVNKLNKNTIIIKTIDQSINEINKYVDSKFKSKYSIVNFYYKAFSIDYNKIHQ